MSEGNGKTMSLAAIFLCKNKGACMQTIRDTVTLNLFHTTWHDVSKKVVKIVPEALLRTIVALAARSLMTATFTQAVDPKNHIIATFLDALPQDTLLMTAVACADTIGPWVLPVPLKCGDFATLVMSLGILRCFSRSVTAVPLWGDLGRLLDTIGRDNPRAFTTADLRYSLNAINYFAYRGAHATLAATAGRVDSLVAGFKKSCHWLAGKARSLF